MSDDPKTLLKHLKTATFVIRTSEHEPNGDFHHKYEVGQVTEGLIADRVPFTIDVGDEADTLITTITVDRDI